MAFDPINYEGQDRLAHIEKYVGQNTAAIAVLNGGYISAVFNVKTTYGAVGDGVTDDTAAIASAIAAAVAAGGGRVYFPFGTYLVTGIDVSGTSGVWLDLGQSTIKLKANIGAPVIHNRMSANGNYGNCSDLKITGGTVDANGFTTGYGIVGLVYVDKLTIDGVTVLHNAANADWAFQLGGRKAIVTGCRVLNGSITFQDGIHVIHGSDWRISDNYVESGDDAIVLGATHTDTRLAANPESIRRVSITNNVVNSQKAYGLSIYVESGATGTSWEITDVAVQGLVGQAGVLANGGIRVIDNNGSGAGTSQIKRVKVRGVNLAVGSTSHDDAGDPEGVIVSSALDVSISDVSLTLTDKTGAATGFSGCTIANSQDVTVDRFNCDALGRRYGVVVTSSNRVDLSRLHLRCTSLSANGPIFLSGVKDFTIDDCALLDIVSGQFGISFSASSGKTSRGSIKRTKFADLTTGGTGVLAALTTFARITLDSNDFSETSTATSPTVLNDPSLTQINLVAGYTSSDTALVVDDETQFQFLDIITVPRTREKMKVTSVVGGTHTVNVVRGVRGTTAAALVDNDWLECRRVVIRDNRGLDDFAPFQGYEKDTAQDGMYCLDPGGQVTTQAGGSNVGRIVRFVPSRDIIVRSIAFAVTAFAAGDTADPAVDVGIYNASGSSRLVSSGATTGKLNSTGAKSIAVTPTTLRAGTVYYLAISIGALGTSTVTLAGVTYSSAGATALFGSTMGLVQIDAANSRHPLPSSWSIGAISSAGWFGAVVEA